MSFEAAVARVTGRDVTSLRRVGGGDINDAYLAELAGGGRAFVKTRADAPAGEYEAEAAALRWLGEPGGVGVPGVLGASDALLALEWLEESGAGDEAALGRGLAIVHQAGAERFGGPAPLRIGRLTLPNDPLDDWAAFYAERRLRPLIGPARLSAAGTRAVEAVCERIHDLAGPPEPPARLHGDLWSGNVHADAAGQDVAAPEVAVQARGRLRRAGQVVDAVAHRLHRLAAGPRQRSLVERLAREREPLLVGVEEGLAR